MAFEQGFLFLMSANQLQNSGEGLSYDVTVEEETTDESSDESSDETTDSDTDTDESTEDSTETE